MANILASVGDGSVTLTAEAVKRLLERGHGDAALLYLALLRRHGSVQPRALAGELRWERERIEAAENVLRETGLIVPQAPALEPADEKPAYQRDDIAGKLEQSAEFRSLTAEVERRLGKKLTTPDVGVLLGLYDFLGLPADVIYLLVCHCAERVSKRYGEGRRPTLRQIEQEGYYWARQGIDSQAAASAYLRKCAGQQSALPRYMRVLQLGDRPPSATEEKYLLSWLQMGFPPEAVALAYDKTVLKCHEFRWSYCNGILKRWHAAGMHSVDEIEQRDRRPAGGIQKAAPPKEGQEGSGVAWMRKYIQQREKGG